MIMTGKNEFGLYETKEDKKFNTIESLKEWNKRFDEAESMSEIRLCTEKCTNLESTLIKEFGMTEDEVWIATH